MRRIPEFPIRLAEELILLMLNERTGYLEGDYIRKFQKGVDARGTLM